LTEEWPVSNLQEYSVSDLSTALKRSVEDQFGLVRVRAELSGVKPAASGHLYFALKDDKSVLDGVCWRGTAQKLSFRPEDGLEVICTGKLTTYAARSKYQMVVESMEPAGAGALMALLDERRKKLAAEGLFDDAHKKPIPFLPSVIGVVTSPTGAVIRDILHRLNDRFPRRVIVWPVVVQGQTAADQIAAAIDGFNSLKPDDGVPRPDVLIVARGGGSIEDLWSFNEEVVVRAAAASKIPLISAVGHETDTTLIDFASDLRAPTPTGAAEFAVPVREDLLFSITDTGRRLALQKQSLVQGRRDKLDALGRALPSPSDILGMVQQRFDDLCDRLPRALSYIARSKESALNRVSGGLTPGRLTQAMKFHYTGLGVLSGRLRPAYGRFLTAKNDGLLSIVRVLESLSFERILDRGFALVENAEGLPVSRAGDLSTDDMISLRFADGALGAQIVGEPIGGNGKNKPKQPIRKKANQPVAKSKKSKNSPAEDDLSQGKLF